MATPHDFSYRDLSGQVLYRTVEIHKGVEYPRTQIVAWYNEYWRVNTGVPAHISRAVAAAVHEINQRPEPAKASDVRNLIVKNL